MADNLINTTDVEELLEEGRDRYEFARKCDADDLMEAEADNRFCYAEDTNLDQWDEKAKKARRKLPIIQWNRIPTYVQQVVNDGRQNKPSIKIDAMDGGLPETAEFFQSRIRQIEYDANADTAKDMAREQQVVSGRGFIRVSLERNPGRKGQHICIDRIDNQFSVVWDPGSVKYDRTDADYCFVISYITQEEHIRRFGKDSIVSQLDFATMTNNPAPGWIGVGENGRMIQVAEYWRKKYAGKDDDDFEVEQHVINGAEVLESTRWIGNSIPIVPVWGKEATVNGQRRTFSLVRNAKSPQRLINLTVSNIVLKLGQMAKSPFKVPVGGIPAENERDWQNVNNVTLAYLLYNSYDTQGRALPPPDRVDYEPPIQGLLELLKFSIDGLKAAMGIFDAALGAEGNEKSGIALKARQKQSDVSNYHFPSNEARSNKYFGEILIDLIPKVDRPGSKVPIRTPDGKTILVPIGEAHKDWKTGQMVTHDLLNGQYGVSVATGPSYESAREEENNTIGQAIQAKPELLDIFGDIFFRTADTPNADQLGDRMKRYINMKFPGLIQEQTDEQQLPPQVQAQIQQMGAKLQKTEQFAQSLHEQLQTKAPELEVKKLQIQSDSEMKKYTVDEQEKTKRTLGLATINSQQALEKLDQELGIVHKKLDVMVQAHMKAADQAHAQQLQEGQQAHAAEMGQQGHQQAMEQSQQQHAGAMEQQANAQDAAAEQAEAAAGSDDDENAVESAQES